MKVGLTDKKADDLHTEYCDMSMSVEIVSTIQMAIDHILTYGRWVIVS